MQKFGQKRHKFLDAAEVQQKLDVREVSSTFQVYHPLCEDTTKAPNS